MMTAHQPVTSDASTDVLEQTYNAEFFAEWGRKNPDYVESAAKIADKIHAMFQPGTLADLGCGCGVYSHLFQTLGAKVFSLDGVLSPAEYSYPVNVTLQDLSVPFANRWGTFDLAVCFEVGEHIDPDKADIFLRNVTQFSSRVLLSCAPPHQGGHSHVNEQPKRYWVKKMAELGFVYNRPSTGRLQEAIMADPPRHCWMFSQISVYEKAGAFGPVEPCMPFQLRYETPR